MKNEMEILGMDERQCAAWLRANRLTLLLVGLVWIGMIAWEVAQGRTPWFLIAMVPVIAATRALLFLFFSRAGR